MNSQTPWQYIKLSQLMDSVKEDLHLYDEANLIDEDRVIKIVALCNEKLGERIYRSRSCKLTVKDYRAIKPSDLWKIENMFATRTQHSGYGYAEGGNIIAASQIVWTDTPPPKFIHGEPVIPMACKTLPSCETDCDLPAPCAPKCDRIQYVSRIDRKQAEMMYKDIRPLILSNSVLNKCADYAPCKNWQGSYQVDLENEEFRFSFKEGEVYLDYLGDMVDDEGELVIPLHPMLNQYYEYSVKAKLMEDIFVNSEAQVSDKMQYFKAEASKGYYDAFMYVNSAKVGQWSQMRDQAKKEFYNKWYKGL